MSFRKIRILSNFSCPRWERSLANWERRRDFKKLKRNVSEFWKFGTRGKSLREMLLKNGWANWGRLNLVMKYLFILASFFLKKIIYIYFLWIGGGFNNFWGILKKFILKISDFFLMNFFNIILSFFILLIAKYLY